MDREILFRGKDKCGDWHYGSFVYTTSNRVNQQAWIIQTSRSSGGWFIHQKTALVDQSTVGQFTGLCDDKRRKVFEGDIIDVRGRFKSEVRYVSHNAGYLVKDNYGDWKWLYDVLASMFCEVIGNIHDNPELVKEESE